MLREITLGQYYPAKSVLHTLDPRVKLFSTLIFIITLFSANNAILFAFVLITLFGIISDLAMMLGTDKAAIMNELEAMENDHIICGYPTLINWDKADVEKVSALIEVRVTPQRGMGFDKVAERIYNSYVRCRNSRSWCDNS